MQIQNEHHSFTGMQRDLSPSKHPTSFLYDAKNIRLTPREGDTMFAITNERGTEDTKIVLNGIYLGHCILNEYLVVFTTDSSHNYIHKVNLETTQYTQLYKGNLKFDVKYPIKAIGSFENKHIQKVYWTDGKNQPRVINIVSTNSYTSSSFDFIPKLRLEEEVTVKKILGSGEFPPGVIQYAFTYFNKYMQESNIFHVTPLNYISYADRAGSPEDKIANTFKLDISDVDTNFDYLRIYSILRTSLNGTPIVKRVQDISLKNSSIKEEDDPEDNTGGTTPDDPEDNIPDNPSIIPEDSPRNWLFRYGENIETIEISTNGGETFESAENYQYNPSDLMPPRSIEIGWIRDIINGYNSRGYLFRKSELPNLVVRLTRENGDKYHYTWTSDANSIFIGCSKYGYIMEEGSVGYTVVIGGTTEYTNYNQESAQLLYYTIGNNTNIIYGEQGEKSPIEISSSFKETSNIQNEDIYISYDDGFTYSSIPYEYTVDIEDTAHLKDIDIWSDIYKNSYNKSVFKIDYSKLGLCILKIGNYYYKCEDNNSILYIGIIHESTGVQPLTVIMGVNENNTITTSNVLKYSISSPISTVQEGRIITPTIKSISFIDDGTKGDIIDPTELLYKGGEIVKAKSIVQKDNTLFLGNISILREHPNITNKLYEYNKISVSDLNNSYSNNIANDNITSVLSSRSFRLNSPHIYGDDFPVYSYNSLNRVGNNSYPGTAFFKSKEYYRLGIQFQHENGKWTEPYWIGDKQCNITPKIEATTSFYNCDVKAGEFLFTLKDTEILELLIKGGYKKARGLYAVPSINDRTILCQGIVCPTLFRYNDRYVDKSNSDLGSLYAQSSWIFRYTVPYYIKNNDYKLNASTIPGGGVRSFEGKLKSHFNEVYSINTENNINKSPYIFSTEVMGVYSDRDSYYIDHAFSTLHSPDIVFDDSFYSTDFSSYYIKEVGHVHVKQAYGDINIQTTSPTIGSSSKGFKHSTFKVYNGSLISGLFYDDYIVNDLDATPKYGAYNEDSNKSPVSWPIFMWHKNGSLNNDVNRSGRSAELLKKTISNYVVSDNTTYYDVDKISRYTVSDIKLFKEDQLSLIKVNGKPYMGNINTMLNPEDSPYYFFGAPNEYYNTPTYDSLYVLSTENILNGASTQNKSGLWKYNFTDLKWGGLITDIGESVAGLTHWREGVSIKYKSTPHLIIDYSGKYPKSTESKNIPLVEVIKDYDKNLLYGGTTKDALYAATWIPCGPAVDLNDSEVHVEYKWGDTYLQRYECLKTYPFTTEDKNQVVEILSFLCETRVNIEGRYDRNKEQTSNLNVSPTNFNLLNPVYSQLDNFFSYRILEEDYYNIFNYPNQITWTKEKQPGSEVDTYTNLTLASTYDLDGSKGEITSLNVWNDTIYCFQNKGVSNILFNSRVQIPTSDNVPIEITNSYKVDGYRYISDSIGCDDKSKIKETPSGIYFIDSTSNKLYNIGSNLSDITTTKNMSSWFKDNGKTIKKLLYDNIHNDLYLLTSNEALCFSEILGQFTSFMDYANVDIMESYGNNTFALHDSNMYKLFSGEYNKFFGKEKPWEFTFISSGVDSSLSDFDKIFSNIDYRLDIKESGEYKHDKSLDYIRVENEYQDTGEVQLVNKKPVDTKVLYTKEKKKFRIWRIQIPRDKTHKMDRIRNTWCKITLGNYGKDDINPQVILHDLNVQYYV